MGAAIVAAHTLKTRNITLNLIYRTIQLSAKLDLYQCLRFNTACFMYRHPELSKEIDRRILEAFFATIVHPSGTLACDYFLFQLYLIQLLECGKLTLGLHNSTIDWPCRTINPRLLACCSRPIGQW